MGIKGFSTLLKSLKANGHSLVFSVNPRDFAGKCVSIDVSQKIYVYTYTTMKDLLKTGGTVNDDIVFASVRLKIFKLIESLLSWDIMPVFVFDGATSEFKLDTSEKRRKTRESSVKRLEKAYEENDETRIQSGEASLYRLEWSYFRKLHDEICCVGFQSFWLDDIGGLKTRDAEAFCAALSISGYCDACMTTDSDYHTFGGQIAIKDMTSVDVTGENGATFRETHFVCTFLDSYLNALQLSYQQFIDFCILCGNDYNDNIPKVGPMTALKLLHQHATIEQLPEKYDTSVLRFAQSREIFTFPFTVSGIIFYGFSVINFNRTGREYLSEKSFDRVRNLLEMKYA